jgi:hypothetical protein
MSIEEIRSQLKKITYTLYIGMDYNGKLKIASIPISADNDNEAVKNTKLALDFIAKRGYLIGSSSYEYALGDPQGKIIPVEE